MGKIIATAFWTQKGGRHSFYGGQHGRSEGTISTFMNGPVIGIDVEVSRPDKTSGHVRVQFVDIHAVRAFIKELQERERIYEEPDYAALREEMRKKP